MQMHIFLSLIGLLFLFHYPNIQNETVDILVYDRRHIFTIDAPTQHQKQF